MDVLDCEAGKGGIVDDGQKYAGWTVMSCIGLLPEMQNCLSISVTTVESLLRMAAVNG